MFFVFIGVLKMSFYSQAKHNEAANVWKKFDNDTSYPHSTNYTDEKDAKEQHIQTINDNGKNIEDKYYNEGSGTYDNDSKYFNNNTKESGTTDDTWIYVGLGVLGVMAIMAGR